MKFSCNKCETKYSIADEKVRGKVLKIRCKKCENIIVLREKPVQSAPVEEATRAVELDPGVLAGLRAKNAAANAGAGVVPSGHDAPAVTVALRHGGFQGDERHQQSGNAAVATQPRKATPALMVEEWYLAIKGQQVGPMTLRDAHAKFIKGEADERTYGWRDGMGDWKRLPDIAEFKALLAKPAAPPPPLPRETPPPPPVDDGAGAQVVDLQAEIARRKRGAAVAAADEPASFTVPVRQPTHVPDAAASLASLLDDAHNTPGAAFPLVQPEALEGAAPVAAAPAAVATTPEDPFGNVPDAAGGMEGPPRESTRMFIAAAGLANRSQKLRIYAAVGGGVTSLLALVVYLDAAGIYQIPLVSTLVNAGYEAFEVEQPKARKERVVEDDGEGMDLSFLTRKPKVPKLPRSRGQHNNPNGGLDGLDLGQGPDLSGLGGATAGQGAGGTFTHASDEAAVGGEPSTNAEANKQIKIALAGVSRGPVVVQGTAPITVTAASGPKVSGDKVPLTPAQISKVVTDQHASLNQCANDAAKKGEKFSGTAHVTLVIGPSGKVKSAKIPDVSLSDTTLGNCLGRALLRWIFPRFDGEEFEADIPLKLTVGK